MFHKHQIKLIQSNCFYWCMNVSLVYGSNIHVDTQQVCQRNGSNDELCRSGQHFGILSVDFVKHSTWWTIHFQYGNTTLLQIEN